MELSWWTTRSLQRLRCRRLRGCVTVTLDANDERLRVLLDILSKHNITWRDWRRDYYTEEELGSARLIIMAPLPANARFSADPGSERSTI